MPAAHMPGFRTTRSSRRDSDSHDIYGWQVKTVDAPFEFIHVRDAGIEQITEVASIEQIAALYLEVGGQISAPPLNIPGIGRLLHCENADGEHFCFLEEESPVRPETY